MAPQDQEPVMPPVDPDFARLFRNEQPPSAEAPAPPPPSVPAAAEPSAAPVESAGTPVSADTGRLFRSQGVSGPSTALLAITSHQGSKLRSLSRTSSDDAQTPAPRPVDGPVLAPPPSGDTKLEAAPVGVPQPADAPRPTGARGRSGGMTATAVYLLIIGVTVLVAFINALLFGGKIGWLTGIALLIVTVFCALKVRRDDDITAIITPPIAFFVAAITAAQFFLGESQRSLVNRAVVMFFTLADNWVWIIGSTIAAAVIVLVRRRK